MTALRTLPSPGHWGERAAEHARPKGRVRPLPMYHMCPICSCVQKEQLGIRRPHWQLCSHHNLPLPVINTRLEPQICVYMMMVLRTGSWGVPRLSLARSRICGARKRLNGRQLTLKAQRDTPVQSLVHRRPSSTGLGGGRHTAAKERPGRGAFRKLFSLARPQTRILSAAIGLLFVSSAVTMVCTFLSDAAAAADGITGLWMLCRVVGAIHNWWDYGPGHERL
jgi:hypothetical protein